MLTETFYPWATPMSITDISLSEFDRTALRALILELAETQTTPIESQVAETAKQGLKESPLNFFETNHEHAEVIKLQALLLDALTLTIQEANAEAWLQHTPTQTFITESWYHVTQTGGFHDSHLHPNCSWCGIFCLDSEEAAGTNRFYDPRIAAGVYQDAGTAYLNQEGFWDINLAPNQAVFFPSYIKHSALPYLASAQRIVIAFNSVTEFI